jgi:hypothetical protein
VKPSEKAAPPTTTPGRGATGEVSPGATRPDAAGLVFVAEMYGVQLDQLAAVLGTGEPRARAVTSRWRQQGLAESARLSPGPAWVWLTRAGLASCGLPYSPAPPALSRLAHIRAVTAVRLALEAVPLYHSAGAYWRSERRLRARLGGRLGRRDHLPDGEVHWPDTGPGTGLAPVAWAGECWAVEAELTPKTVSRTAAIMAELLARTGDYGCTAGEAVVPGRPARHARALYVCSPAARPTVTRARDSLGRASAGIEIRPLPPQAQLAPAVPPARGRAPARQAQTRDGNGQAHQAPPGAVP